MKIKPAKYKIIDDEKSCKSLLNDLYSEDDIAVDTETNGEEALTYWNKVYELRGVIKDFEPELMYYENKYKSLPGVRKDSEKKLAKELAKQERDEARAKHRSLTSLMRQYERKAGGNPGGLDWYRNKTGCLQLGTRDEVFLIRPHVVDKEGLESLLNSRKTILMHSAQFDWKQLAHDFDTLLTCNNLYDSYIIEYLMRNGTGQLQGLAPCMLRYFNVEVNKSKSSARFENWCGEWSEEMCQYAANDVAWLFPLREAQQKDKAYEMIAGCYERYEKLLVPAIATMEMNGVGVDLGLVEQAREHALKAIQEKEKELRELIGDINPNSPAQVLSFLRAKGLKTDKTDKKTLNKHKHNKYVAALLEYRKLYKPLSTYYNPMVENAVELEDGSYRIYANFNATGKGSGDGGQAPETGRLSSSNPNLQNQPARTTFRDKEGNERLLREMFIPSSGWSFVNGDLSQIELRILAYLSQDRRLLQAFEEDIDVHTLAAQYVFGVEAEYEEDGSLCKWWDDKYRYKTKTIQYGIIYGQTEYGLGPQLGIPRWKASELIRLYFAQYTGVKKWIDETNEKLHKQKYAASLGGRVRWLNNIDHPKKYMREHAERQGRNMFIQGSAADGVKRSNIYLDQAIINRGWQDIARNVLTVHDENTTEYKKGEGIDNGLIMLYNKELIRGTQELIPTVPVKVGSAPLWSAKIGSNWGQLK